MDIPTGPSSLYPAALKANITLRESGAPRPMPVANPDQPGGFPMAKHRSTRSYKRRDVRTAASSSSPSFRGDTLAQRANTTTASTPSTDNASFMDKFASGALDAEMAKGQNGDNQQIDWNSSSDPIADHAVVSAMVASEETNLIAAASVVLRSRSSLERAKVFERLTTLPKGALIQQLASSDPTVAAQFILALRLTLDSQNATQLADSIRILSALCERDNEKELFSVLSESWNGLVVPLASWYEERTIFGLGVSSLTAPQDPTEGAPTAKLWDPLGSLQELASIVQCDVLEGIAKVQTCSRILFLLENPTLLPNTPWVEGVLLETLHSLSLSKRCAEVIAATPGLIERLVKMIDTETALGNDTTVGIAITVLNNLAKVSSEVSSVIFENNAWVRVKNIVLAVSGTKGTKISPLLRSCFSFLRTGLLLKHCSSNLAADLFGIISMLCRNEFCYHALSVLDAHALTYTLRITLEGSQQVGLLDFALSDLPGIVETCLASPQKETAGLFISYAFSVMTHAVESAPSTVGMMERICTLFERSSADRIATPLFTYYNVPAAVNPLQNFVAPKLGKNCPKFGSEVLQEIPGVVAGLVHSNYLKLHSTGVELRFVGTAERTKGLLKRYVDILIPTTKDRTFCDQAQQHLQLSRQQARYRSALLRNAVELYVVFMHMTLRCGDDVTPFSSSDRPSYETLFGHTALNLSLLILPSDGVAFRLILSIFFDSSTTPLTKLHNYFKGSFSIKPDTKDSLYLAFAPGRLEPQGEWIFLPVADASNDGNNEAAGRFLTVRTRGVVTEDVLREWGMWLVKVMGAEGSYAGLMDWREVVLRVGSVFAASSSNLATTYLLGCLGSVVAGCATPSTGSLVSTRLAEAPLQIAKRILHKLEAESGGDPVFCAYSLLLLHESFPEEVNVSAVNAFSSPHVAHCVGTAFGSDSSTEVLFIGLKQYFGERELENDEAAFAYASMFGGRDANTANLLHLLAVHKLAGYVFEEDGTCAFPAERVLAALSPATRDIVTRYVAPTEAGWEAIQKEGVKILQNGAFLAACVQEGTSEVNKIKIESVRGLGLKR